jgi:hypothetical protein
MTLRFNPSASATAAALLFVGTLAVAGQQPPPIDGVTATVATEGTVQKTDQAVHEVVAGTVDGIERLFHLTDPTGAHGGKASGDQALSGLDEGARVVVRGSKTIEGVVTNVDRRAKTMSIRLANGSRQTLQLTEHAASGAGTDLDGRAAGPAKVVVSFIDEAGEHVAYYFRRIS